MEEWTQTHQTFPAWLYRPYLDLGSAPALVPFHVSGLEIGSRSFLEDKSYPRIQASLNSSFRNNLIAATGLNQYDIARPVDLPVKLRTQRWQKICDAVDNFSGLPSRSQVRLIWLLAKLGFYRFVLDIIPPTITDHIQDGEDIASLAYLHANARYRLFLDGEEQGYSLDEFELVATQAPVGIARIDSHYQMVVQHVKHADDIEGATHWQTLHLQAIECSIGQIDEFTQTLVMSRYHRVGGFLPQMRRDKAGVIREMELAEEFARALPRDSDIERIAADEMLYPTIESRIKEALWMGDFELAIERAHSLTELSPYDPRPWLNYGEVLLERNEIEKALSAYRTAARFAPPGQEVACFMAGQCYEELGELELACDSYIAALRVDPMGISSAERLESLSRRIDCKPILQWVERLHADLREKKARMPIPRVERYTQLPAPLVNP
jgi:tetratricopeptide (TPR) repeat protein